MTAVLADEVPAPRAGHGSLSFRFVDVNPLTGRSFHRSMFDSLPLLIQTVVEQRLGFTAWAWNKMVRSGEVAELVDVTLRRPVPWTSSQGWRKPPGWTAPENPCPDCEGRCAVKDSDGSITGVRGGWYVCGCTRLASRSIGRGGRW